MKKLLLCFALASVCLVGCGKDSSRDPSGGSCQTDEAVAAAWRAPTSLGRIDPTPAEGADRYVVHFASDSTTGGTGPAPLMLPRDAGPTDADVALIEHAGGRVARRLNRQRAAAAYLTADGLRALRQSRNVRAIEPDRKRYPLAQSTPWGISAIGAPEAWAQAGTLAPGIKTCIVDSGVRATHEDLHFGEVSGTPEDWQDDRCGHGTHVAGTIGAFDNDLGVVGVNPAGLDLFVVKVFGEQCQWTYGSELAAALEQCQAAGAKVVNLSLGGYGGSEVEAKAFADAWQQGMLLVAAAGNDGGTGLEYPASYPTVISVGAVDSSRNVASFSQHNARLDLVAPGVQIQSTIPFVSRHQALVDQTTWEGGPIHNSAQTQGVTGALVDGALCESPGAWLGKVVLCERGQNTFAEKLAVVERGGGVAAIIFNNEPGTFTGTVGETPSAVPAIALSGLDGDALLRLLGHTAKVVNEVEEPGSGYASYSGTSMAAPHVTGAAAMIWGQAQGRTNAEVREALESTALDLEEPGRDDRSGHGFLRADLALARLRSGAPVEGRPIAGFLTSCEGLECQFADVSLDPDGSIAERAFDFGDGATSTDVSTTHTFRSAGARTVRLRVKDDRGLSAETAVPVSVVELTATGGPLKGDGSREVALSWSGVAGDSAVVVRNGAVVGTTGNTGGAVDTVPKASGELKYRVCSPGAESCSTEVTVLPVCG